MHMHRSIFGGLLATVSLLAFAAAAAEPSVPPAASPDAPAAEMHAMDGDMQAVIDKLASLGGKPIETLSPEEARDQPTPADAVSEVMKDRKIEVDSSVETDDTSYTAADG